MPDDPTTAPQVVIFAKAPVLGGVKTRIAADLGDQAALTIYTRMLARTVARLMQGPWQVRLAVTPDATAPQPALWPAGPDRFGQGPGDLGARMLQPLRRAGPAAPVVIVGSDIPALDAAHIAAALAALRTAPLVFGPSADGGFYLVGAAAPPDPALFADVIWSCETTLAQIMAKPAAAKAVILPDCLDDFDDIAALARHGDAADWTDLVAGVVPQPITGAPDA